jgi:hypothetical protein
MQSPLKLRRQYKCESPAEVVYKPMIQVSINRRKSQKLLIKPKSPLQSPLIVQPSSPSNDLNISRPSSSHNSTSPTRTTFISYRKVTRPQSCKLNPVITNTLSSSYRKSSKIYIASSDITSFLRKKKIQMSSNIFITGKNCLLSQSRNI